MGSNTFRPNPVPTIPRLIRLIVGEATPAIRCPDSSYAVSSPESVSELVEKCSVSIPSRWSIET